MGLTEDQKWEAQADVEALNRAAIINADSRRKQRAINYAQEVADNAIQSIELLKKNVEIKDSKVIRIA